MMAPLMRLIAYVSNLMAPAEIELLDGVDEPENAVRDEIGLLDIRRQTHPDPTGDIFHQRRVMQDQALADAPDRRRP